MIKNSNRGERAVRVAKWNSSRPWFTHAAFAIFFGLGVVLVSANAHARGDKIRGAALAESWCQSCHIIDKKGTGRAIDQAPAFPVIANDPRKSPGYLQQWLSRSHPQMPNFNLGHRDIVDLIAYIHSLSDAPAKDPQNKEKTLKKTRRDASLR